MQLECTQSNGERVRGFGPNRMASGSGDLDPIEWRAGPGIWTLASRVWDTRFASPFTMGGSAGGSLSLLGKAQKTSRLLCPPYPPSPKEKEKATPSNS